MPKPQPNSKQCFVCGVANPVGLKINFYENAEGETIADYTVPQEYQGYPGIVHGGIVAAMLDEVAGRAHMGDNEHPRFMYTARLVVRYRKHVPVGRPIHLVGKAGKMHGKLATAQGAIYDETGALLAESEALLVEVPMDELNQVDLEQIGWKVYDKP